MSAHAKAGSSCPAFVVLRLGAAGLLLACALLFAWPGPADAAYRDGHYQGEELFSKSPLLTIAYSAESRGEVRPCASCGGKLGGLARRAGLLAALRQEAVPLLYLLGPGEFSADLSAAARQQRAREWQLPEEGEVSPARIMAAYTALRPRAAYLSAEAGRWFRAAQVKIPDFFISLDGSAGRAASRVIEVGDRKIGLVFFAPGDLAGKAGKSLEQARAGALFAGRQLAPRVHLLIGISPWGFQAERDFLPEAAGLFHILLGGGSGPGFAAASSAYSGQILWSRPAASGVGLNIISLYRWPEAGPLHWEPALTYEARQEFLGPGLKEDPALLRLLDGP